MVQEHSTNETATRRTVLKGGSLLVGGLLAGCTGGGEESAADPTPTETGTATSDRSYSVSIAPIGEVTFETVPETWIAGNGSWADMGIALGQAPPRGVWLPGRYHTQYYEEIPGISVDKSDLRKLWGDGGVGNEQFYEINADVHVADPNFLLNRGKWEQSDIDDITTNVGPFFGNSIFSRSYPWHEDYRYYTLMEAFEKLAAVFQEQERYEAFEAVHESFQADLAPIVPEREQRPSVAVIWGSGDAPEEFYPYVIDDGTSFKHLTDLKVTDALAHTDVKNFFTSRAAIDYETLAEIDPEVLLVRGQEAKSAEQFRNTVVESMAEHTVGSELTAVQNDDVYRGGPLYQGPITNLVVTERLAQALYGVAEELFDRQRVADIVSGDAL